MCSAFHVFPADLWTACVVCTPSMYSMLSIYCDCVCTHVAVTLEGLCKARKPGNGTDRGVAVAPAHVCASGSWRMSSCRELRVSQPRTRVRSHRPAQPRGWGSRGSHKWGVPSGTTVYNCWQWEERRTASFPKCTETIINSQRMHHDHLEARGIKSDIYENSKTRESNNLPGNNINHSASQMMYRKLVGSPETSSGCRSSHTKMGARKSMKKSGCQSLR